MKLDRPHASSSLATIVRVDRRAFLVGAGLLSTLGCRNFVRRSQSPDDLSKSITNDLKQPNAGYISESCRIFGANYKKIEGIGLAFGLKDTGSNPKPGGQREHLARELGTKDLDIDIPTLLAGKDTELVLLKGLIPPGAKEGDRFDVEVGTMRSSDGSSIENGMVGKTRMFPIETMGKAVKKGNVSGSCQGRILVDALFESRQDQANRLHGYILGGGVVTEAREIGLQLANEEVSTRTSIGIARAINTRFTYADRTGRHGIASPKTDRFVSLVVPQEYKHNLGRFLDVVTNIVHSETANELLERMDQLEKAIADPPQAELAVFRLEAIGKNGIPILKRVLRTDNVEVKFYAAEALAYLGEPDGIDHLQWVAESEPAFRWAAITALSTLPGSDSAKVLGDLLHSKSAETRYGAFQSLQTHSPDDPLVAGTMLGDFRLHRISSATDQPMLHFTRKQRAEIVIFGDQQTVSEEFMYVEPGLTIKGTKNGHVAITRHSSKGEQRLVVTSQVGDVIQGLQQAGFSYGDLLKIFRQAKNAGTLNSRLVINAQPKLGRTYVPGQFAEDQTNANSKGDISKNEPSGYDHDHPNDDESRPTTLTKMKNWFTGKK